MMPIHHTIVGLPRSGKTTFLAALYHLIDSGEVKSKLRIASYVGDQSYLNNILETWLECKEVIRTSQASNTKVELLLENQETGRMINLAFPDLAGEIFEMQVAQRRCRPEYVEGCNANGGILLFVSPDRPADDGMTLVEQSDAFGQPTPDQIAKIATATTKPWSHKMIPTQVQLVELLQFMQLKPFTPQCRRVAVIVSAWDLVAQPRPEPHVWLQCEMPLLSQFLQTNQDAFESRIYGISALGADIKNAERRNALIGTTHSERVICVGPDCSSHDLTVPILWLTPEG
jgi:hypothetical protein